jgi:hypothetical protein
LWGRGLRSSSEQAKGRSNLAALCEEVQGAEQSKDLRNMMRRPCTRDCICMLCHMICMYVCISSMYLYINKYTHTHTHTYTHTHTHTTHAHTHTHTHTRPEDTVVRDFSADDVQTSLAEALD